MQTIAALAALKAAGLAARIPELFLGLTEPAKAGKRNGLRDLLDAHSVADARARYRRRRALLGAHQCRAAAGRGARPRHRRDPRRRRGGARAGAGRASAPAEVPAAVGAALSVALAETRASPSRCMMAYADRLERFTRWYVQLWAESLGKDGKGTTPIAALGPVDQHSQLQLFIAGPRDKLFTVITTAAAGTRPAHRRPISPSSRASRTSPARPSAISSPRRAAPPPRRWPRTAARCAPSTSTSSTRRASANC